jgi:decaprenylphospho-beta-D-ribofuranose 2-oxidase
MLNPLSVRAFNELYFRKHPPRLLQQIAHYEPFFFPLDFVKRWNLIYGRRGFLQYQLVVPHDPQHKAIREVLELISAAGMGSFLAVIKEFGELQHPHLSFPMPGVTLALDFPHYGAPLLALLNQLDRVVIEAGGRVYLGKDARLPQAHFREMYPDWQRWRALKERYDPEALFRSSLSERLGLTGP